MKTAVVYYSMEGNTEFAAKKIAEKLDADLISLHPMKIYPHKGIKKFLFGGKSAMMGECPRLKPYTFDLSSYDAVILGTPVWAGNFAPPLRTFIKDNEGLREKRLGALMCMSGNGAKKAMQKMKEELRILAFQAELVLIDPKTKERPENEAKIEEFCTAMQAD